MMDRFIQHNPIWKGTCFGGFSFIFLFFFAQISYSCLCGFVHMVYESISTKILVIVQIKRMYLCRRMWFSYPLRPGCFLCSWCMSVKPYYTLDYKFGKHHAGYFCPSIWWWIISRYNEFQFCGTVDESAILVIFVTDLRFLLVHLWWF